MLLHDRIALITGGAKGIGASCASTFASNGTKALILVDVDELSGRETESLLQSKCECIFMKADVSNEEDMRKVYGMIQNRFDRLDILMNIAGICSTQRIFEVDMKSWELMMNINLKGSFLFAREALRMMMKQRYGRIVNMASIAGQVGGIRTSPAYAASKAGIICMTKTMAKASAKEGVTVNALSPGLVDTDMTRDPDFNFSVDEVPMGRVAKPEEIADVALFLASDLSRYMTGQCLNVNGGMYMS